MSTTELADRLERLERTRIPATDVASCCTYEEAAVVTRYLRAAAQHLRRYADGTDDD